MMRAGLFRTLLLALVATAVLASGLVSAGAAEAPTAPTMSTVTIAARDGVRLTGALWRPTGPGPHPLIVTPAAWGGESNQMSWANQKLAERGFVVVNYATRGFKESEGDVNVAGPEDVADVSDIISWAIVNADVDASRVGVWGLSYGAGLALLAAAADPRIKAVVSLEGFADLRTTVYPNRTRSTVLLAGLLWGGIIAGRIPEDVLGLFGDFFNGRNTPAFLDYLRVRSPIEVVDAINRNHTAVMMATSWNDVAYGTDQIVGFYDKLTVPHRRLEVRPGDHVTNEVPGAVGLGDGVMYGDTFDWLSTYVAGDEKPIAKAPAVWLQPRSSAGKPPVEQYPAWHPTGAEPYALGQPAGLIQPTGPIATGSVAPWSTDITDGLNIASAYGVPILGYSLEAVTGNPPQNQLWAVDRGHAVVWQGTQVSATTRLRGAARLAFNLTPSAPKGTVVAYLYDVSGGTGSLICHRPYSFDGATPGDPIRVDLPFQPTAYDLPAGHSLGVVLATNDPIYANENPSGATLRISSTTAWPARLTIPATGAR
jgi:predicted acyl esterase